MKRKAILIGNTSGLNGVKVDLVKFRSFLQADIGGAWNGAEIQTIQNPKRIDLLREIEIAKILKFDYTIVMFSGHGGYEKRKTQLEINSEGETVSEAELMNISLRQLNIYDCCRKVVPEEATRADSMAFGAYFSESARHQIRESYDNRIMEAIEQQSSLYSCSINEYSYDSNDGAIYLQNFLSAAANISTGAKLVSTAHQEACQPTLDHSKKEGRGLQNPDAALPKCLSQQQLIISLKRNPLFS